jgi:hypothetical protein
MSLKKRMMLKQLKTILRQGKMTPTNKQALTKLYFQRKGGAGKSK